MLEVEVVLEVVLVLVLVLVLVTPAVSSLEMIPAWLPLRPDLPGRGALVAEGRARLARDGTVTLAGAPGVGKTAVAGAIVAGSGRELTAVSLAGCEDAADVLRALGEAAGIRPFGDEAALLEALRVRGPVDVVIDDVADVALLEPATRAIAAADARVVLVLDAPADDALSVGPLDPETLAELAPGADTESLDGSPTLARLVAALEVPRAEALARLAASAWLAAFPMGVPSPAGALPAAALRPDADRCTLRRGVATRLAPPPDDEAARRALPELERLLALAVGAHPPGIPDTRDLLLLRRLARMAPTPTDAARCVAAAARLAAMAGQVQVARALLAGPIAARGAPGDLALLLWADADALLAAGEVEEALARYADASSLFRRARDPGRAASLHRRAADRLAARGLVTHADTHYRQARQHYRSDDDAVGVAATLRGAADLAVGAGEWVSAGTLFEQVGTTVDRVGSASIERANLRVAEATLAIARGEFGLAERLLAALAPLAAEHPLLRANVQRRRADLLLRRGDHESATAAARAAGDLYAVLGEAPAHAATTRLLGDVAAAAGRLTDAVARYREAMRLQVRVQDLHGLSRTLEHAALAEDALGEPERARALREQRAAVRELL